MDSRPTLIARAKRWARSIKRDIIALWLAGHDARVALLPKLLAATVAAYALSPIDLIPDFIPVLGYLDDLLIVPLGIMAVVRLIPAPLMAELRSTAQQHSTRPVSKVGLAIVLGLWLLGLLWLGPVLWRQWTPPQ